MLQPKQKIAVYIFCIVTITTLVSIATNLQLLHYAAKPLLMPALMVLLWLTVSAVPNKKLLLTGLFFSWLGDVLLLFENRHALYFILGLISFLTTHIFYIIYFLKIRPKQISLFKKYPFLPALVTMYGITLTWQLFPHLGDLKIPVVVYASVICIMLVCSMHIYYRVNSKAAACYITGALAFVVSDSLLAINKFYTAFPYSGLLIMLTYCAAQYFIVRGYIQQKND